VQWILFVRMLISLTGQISSIPSSLKRYSLGTIYRASMNPNGRGFPTEVQVADFDIVTRHRSGLNNHTESMDKKLPAESISISQYVAYTVAQ
jgi:hypothetical protein